MEQSHRKIKCLNVSLCDWRSCLTEFTDHVTKIKARWNSPLTSFPVINFRVGLLGCRALIYHSWEINQTYDPSKAHDFSSTLQASLNQCPFYIILLDVWIESEAYSSSTDLYPKGYPNFIVRGRNSIDI